MLVFFFFSVFQSGLVPGSKKRRKRKDSGGVGPGILKWRDPLLVLVSLFFFFFFFLFHLLALFKDMLLHRTWAPLFPASWRVFSDRSRFRAHTALASLSQTRSVYLYLYLFEKSPCETKGKKRRWWWHARDEEEKNTEERNSVLWNDEESHSSSTVYMFLDCIQK